MGGIINILCQSESIEDLEESNKILERENITNSARIEVLENWNVQQDKDIAGNTEKVLVNECNEIQSLKNKILSLEIDLNSIRRCPFPSPPDQSSIWKKCSDCDTKFLQNCELENHMVYVHQQEKKHECEICRKQLYLK